MKRFEEMNWLERQTLANSDPAEYGRQRDAAEARAHATPVPPAGKAYGQLTGLERAALAAADPQRFAREREAWNAGRQ